jgi:hypothetical protein
VPQGRGSYPGSVPALSPHQMQLLPGTPPTQLPSPNQASLPALSPTGGFTAASQVGRAAGSGALHTDLSLVLLCIMIVWRVMHATTHMDEVQGMQRAPMHRLLCCCRLGLLRLAGCSSNSSGSSSSLRLVSHHPRSLQVGSAPG